MLRDMPAPHGERDVFGNVRADVPRTAAVFIAPVRMTAEYPKLPATATSVSVWIPNFAPVTVPVTR